MTFDTAERWNHQNIFFFCEILRNHWILVLLQKQPRQTDLILVALVAFVSQTSCKSAVAFFQFSILANYFWLLVEGMYLQTLLALTFSFQKKYFWWYIVIGWGESSLYWTFCFVHLCVPSFFFIHPFCGPRSPNNNHNSVDSHSQVLRQQGVSFYRRKEELSQQWGNSERNYSHPQIFSKPDPLI